MSAFSESLDVLIVEDDQFKQELVEKLIREHRPEAHITVCRSVQRAVEFVRSNVCDLIILDISLPSHESRPGGSQPISQPAGGVELLLELAYEERGDRVVVLTQYPDIEWDGKLYPLDKFSKAVSTDINVNIAEILLFNPKDDGWRRALIGTIA